MKGLAMPFTKQEAAEWADLISELKDEFVGRSLSYGNLENILDTFLEAIGGDAENAGWCSEWEDISRKAYRSRDRARTRAERLHAKAAEVKAAKMDFGNEYPCLVERIATVEKLADYAEMKASDAAERGELSVEIEGWPLESDIWGEYWAPLNARQARKLADILEKSDFDCSVRERLYDGFSVVISW